MSNLDIAAGTYPIYVWGIEFLAGRKAKWLFIY